MISELTIPDNLQALKGNFMVTPFGRWFQKVMSMLDGHK